MSLILFERNHLLVGGVENLLENVKDFAINEFKTDFLLLILQACVEISEHNFAWHKHCSTLCVESHHLLTVTKLKKLNANWKLLVPNNFNTSFKQHVLKTKSFCVSTEFGVIYLTGISQKLKHKKSPWRFIKIVIFCVIYYCSEIS